MPRSLPLPQVSETRTPQRHCADAVAATAGVRDAATSYSTQSPTLTLRYHEPKSQNIDAPVTMHRTVNDSSRCARLDTMYSRNNRHGKGSTTIMMHVPKLRPEQRTEVPELAAAAAIGTLDAATSSKRFHVPSETGNAQRVSGWAFTNSVAILVKMAHRHPLKRTPRLASLCPNIHVGFLLSCSPE